MSELSTIWGNTDGCADQYRCASALYLMLVLSQRHPVKIYWCISAPEHGKDVIDGINAIDKRYMYQWMSNVQLPVSITFDSQILIYSYTHKNDVSLDKEFQKHLSKNDCKYGVIYQGKYRKRSGKRKWTDR